MVSTQQYIKWFHACHNQEIGTGEFLEHIIERIYSHILRAGDSAIDCGANQGRHTFPIARCVTARGLVIGIEALPNLATKLQRRVRNEQLARVVIVNEALGSAKGRCTFSHVEGADAYSGILQRKDLPEWALSTVSTLNVSMTTLDSLIEAHHVDSVRFVKMDLEGGEYDSLRGAPEMLGSADAPLIVFENGRSASADLYGYLPKDWFKLFSDAEYQIFDLFGRPFTKKDWLAEGIPWYFIAAKRIQDIEMVNWELSNLIESVYAALANKFAGKLTQH